MELVGDHRLSRHDLAPGWRTVVAATALAVATWPVTTVRPGLLLDDSWAVALHMLAAGVGGQSRIAFTYGPLGFLAVPLDIERGTLLPALLWVAFVHLSLALVLLFATRPIENRVMRSVVCAVVLVIAGTVSEVQVLAVVVGLAAVRRPRDIGRWPVTALASVTLGALAGWMVMIKFNDGVVVFAVALLCVVAGPRRPRTAAVTLLAAAAMSAGGWAIGEQPFAELPTWWADSIAVAAGYNAGMSVDHQSVVLDMVLLALVLCLVGVAVAVALRGQPLRVSVPWLVVAGMFAFVTFKHSFVRHDPVHSVGVYVAMVVLVTMLPWTRSRRPMGLLLWGGVALLVLLVVTPRSSSLSLHSVSPFTRAAALAEQFRAAANQSSSLPLTLERLRTEAQVPGEVVRAAREGSVQVSPYATAVVAAYGLDWAPLPVFQDYVAYSPRLDDLNAARLASPDGPDRVLWRDEPRIDAHAPQTEPPRQFLTLVCDYREELSSGAWHVLARGASRCGSPRSLGSVRTRSGSPVDLPLVRDNEILIMRVDAATTFEGSIRSVLFKPRAVPVVEVDGQVFAVAAPLLSQPIVLSAPSSVRWVPRTLRRPDSTLSLAGLEGDAAVTFTAVPLAP